MENLLVDGRGWREADARAGAAAYAGAAAIVVVTVGLAFVLHELIPHANLSLLFLTVVLVVAARAGLGPSLLASVLSFLAFNYFFTRPYYTLKVADEGDVATLAFFLVMASITGNLGARMRREMRRRRVSLRRISDLYEFSRLMSAAVDPAVIPGQLATHLQASLERPVRVLVANGDALPREQAGAGIAPELPAAVVEQAWKTPATGAFNSGPWTLFRLAAGDQRIGLAAVYGAIGDESADSARSLCEQAGVAIDRSRLVGDLEETRLVYETEQLRSALLSSVSHDLRTPLASIIGSTTSLLEYGEAFSAADRQDLLATIVDESRRLDRHIQNLLDMTRIGRGGLSLRRDWVDLRDVVSGALHRLQDSRRNVEIVTHLPESLPLLWVHGALLEQALVNLLDNALRFSPPDGTVTIAARCREERMEIDVIDQGPGIPDVERELIFDMFYTARHADRGAPGTGLGLTICRAMVGAHGGSVEALAGPGNRGACMRITLPMAEAAKAAS